ncbi:MAG: hypothetical protein JXB05_23905 [Myxococcaceae bacterium]|nr:hypothetical protein [Myxococcaceae bacterium]
MSKMLGEMATVRDRLSPISKALGEMVTLHDRLSPISKALGEMAMGRDRPSPISKALGEMVTLHDRLSPMSKMLGEMATGRDRPSPMSKALGGMVTLHDRLSPTSPMLSRLFTPGIGVLTSKLADEIVDRHSLGSLAARFAAAGAVGGFDAALVEATMAAAELAASSDGDAAAASLVGASAQSAVIDAVSAVQSLSRHEAVTPEEVEQQALAVLREVLARTISQVSDTISRPKAVALLGVLSLTWTVVWSLLTTYWAKQAAAEATQDTTLLRAELRKGNEAQLEELRKGNEAQLEELRRSHATLERLLENMEHANGKTAFYRVEHQTYLLAERSAGAERLMILHPGQQLMRIRRHYRWLEVECYDYLSGKVARGWVLKEHLRAVTD